MHGKNGTNYGFGRIETKKGNMTCVDLQDFCRSI